MMWSKLKVRIEAGFADCIRGRVEVWNTRYRTAHDHEGEGWITLDKERVHSMGTLSFFAARHEQAARIAAERNLSPQESWKRAEVELASEGVLSLPRFNTALFEYLNLSIEDVLASNQMIIRAFGMFDKRLGKRRLQALDPSSDHELVRSFYRIRYALEGLSPITPHSDRPAAGGPGHRSRQ